MKYSGLIFKKKLALNHYLLGLTTRKAHSDLMLRLPLLFYQQLRFISERFLLEMGNPYDYDHKAG